MALKWIEGFEGVGSSNGSAVSGMAIKYTVTSSDSDITLRAGRVSGHAVEISTASTTAGFQTPALGTLTTIIVGFAFKAAAYGVTHNVLQILDGATIHGTLRINTSGEWLYLRGSELGTQLGSTTSGAAVSTGVWVYLELKVLIADATGGTAQLHVNGVNYDFTTGGDTRNGGNASVDRVKFFGSSNAADDPNYDDIYICDTSGSLVNAFLGSQIVVGIYPDGDGSSTQFTPSTGANYAAVDENPANGDTDYVADATSGHKDLYTYAAAANIANIKGIQMNTTVRLTDATPFSLLNTIKSSSTNSDGSAVAVAGTSYQVIPRIVEDDPNTAGTAWTLSNLNAAEFGVKVN